MDIAISGLMSLSYLDIRKGSEGFHLKILNGIFSTGTIALKSKIIITNICVFHSLNQYYQVPSKWQALF